MEYLLCRLIFKFCVWACVCVCVCVCVREGGGNVIYKITNKLFLSQSNKDGMEIWDKMQYIKCIVSNINATMSLTTSKTQNKMKGKMKKSCNEEKEVI